MDTGIRITTPISSGKHEAETLCIRRSSTPTLLALKLIGRLGTQPCLTRDHNGRGRRYSKLQYRCQQRCWRSVYLGDLNTNDEALLRAGITGKWPYTRSELIRTIVILRARLRHYRKLARSLATRCGYRFHGTLLRRRLVNEEHRQTDR